MWTTLDAYCNRRRFRQQSQLVAIWELSGLRAESPASSVTRKAKNSGGGANDSQVGGETMVAQLSNFYFEEFLGNIEFMSNAHHGLL